MSSTRWLQDTLLENSTKKYFIQHGGLRVNHIAHGIVALDLLGASNSRVEQYINRYKTKLEDPQDHEGEEFGAPLLQEDEALALLGKKKSYYRLVTYYEHKIKEWGSVDAMVKNEFPKLSLGLIAGALHGLIHIGYGIVAKNERVIVDGFALLHYSHNPLIYDEEREENTIDHFGKGDISVMDVLVKVRQDTKFTKVLEDGIAQHFEAKGNKAGFSVKARYLMAVGNDILGYVNNIKVPLVKDSHGVSANLMVHLADWIVDQAIRVYAFSEKRNEFFLLHGVTGSWALQQIIPLLTPADALMALRTFSAALIATYVIRGSPAFNPLNGWCSDDVQDAKVWDKIIEEALSTDRDTHDYKLVQVCRDRWVSLKDKTVNMAEIYMSAAKSCLEFGYS